MQTIWLCYIGTNDNGYKKVAWFFNEIDALHYAIDNGMKVREVEQGDIAEAIKKPKIERKPQANQTKQEIITDGNETSNTRPAPSNTGANPPHGQPGHVHQEVVDQDAALKEAQRQAAIRSQGTDDQVIDRIR